MGTPELEMYFQYKGGLTWDRIFAQQRQTFSDLLPQVWAKRRNAGTVFIVLLKILLNRIVPESDSWLSPDGSWILLWPWGCTAASLQGVECTWPRKSPAIKTQLKHNFTFLLFTNKTHCYVFTWEQLQNHVDGTVCLCNKVNGVSVSATPPHYLFLLYVTSVRESDNNVTFTFTSTHNSVMTCFYNIIFKIMLL